MPDTKNIFDAYGEQFQKSVLKAVVEDTQFFRAVHEYLDAQFLTYEYVRIPYECSCEFFAQYHYVPSFDNLEHLIRAKLHNRELEREVCLKTIYELKNQRTFKDVDYVKEKVISFCKIQASIRVVEKSIAVIEDYRRDADLEPDFEPVFQDFKKVLDIRMDPIGSDFIESFDDMFTEANRRTNVVPTGYELLDYVFKGGYGPGEVHTVAAYTGSGKCLSKGSPIIMFNGEIKLVEDIKTGDLLMGPDSLPRRVLSTTSGTEEMFRITPVKGDSYVVNRSHILSLRCTGGCGLKDYKKGDIVNISVNDYLKKSAYFKHVMKGWRTGVDFSQTNKQLPIEPYFLGIWLGDGDSVKPSITTGDAEVKEYIHGFANRINLDVRVRPEANCERLQIRRVIGTASGNTLLTKMRELNLLKNKHIPHEYKTGSREDRLELLAGLIDSDGYYTHGVYEIATKYKQLSDDILFLARSLGFAAYMHESRKECVNNGVWGDYFRIFISGDIAEIPCKVARRKAAIRKQKKNVLNTGIKVESIGDGKYFGFELDGDGLFLLGDFTVTHNTTFAINVGAWAFMCGKNVLHFTFENSRVEVQMAYASRVSLIPENNIPAMKEEVKSRCMEYTGKIDIQQYTMKKHSMRTVEGYYQRLFDSGIRPDLIILDSPLHLRPVEKADNKIDAISNIWKEVKGFAQTTNLPILVTAQLNRQAAGKRGNDTDVVADAIAIAQDSDSFMTINKGEEDKISDTGQFFLGKNRHGRDGFGWDMKWKSNYRLIYEEPGDIQTKIQAFRQQDEFINISQQSAAWNPLQYRLRPKTSVDVNTGEIKLVENV